MNRKLTLELIEEHDNVNFYSFTYTDKNVSEFDEFYGKYEIGEYEEDLDLITGYFDKIGKIGALERYFRIEGGNLGALPIDGSELRLYVYRLTNGIVILGNGGVKQTRTYQEDPILNSHAENLRSVGNILSSKVRNGQVQIHNNIIYSLNTISIKFIE